MVLLLDDFRNIHELFGKKKKKKKKTPNLKYTSCVLVQCMFQKSTRN